MKGPEHLEKNIKVRGKNVRITTFRPNPGPQWKFLSSGADIVLYGGAAGGGKSWALLFEPLRHIKNPLFGAVIFRRTYAEITNEGSLWDESAKLYGPLGARPNSSDLSWKFSFGGVAGGSVSFAHMQHESDRFLYQGAQIPLMGFDELISFTKEQFWFMLNRSRSVSGVSPYIRATTNPDATSWVRHFIDWWIDNDTGYAIPERSGVIRYFVKEDTEVRWFGTRDEARKYAGGEDRAKSFTFIPSKVSDNQVLLKANPGYITNLKALGRVDRERLLFGNWNIRYQAGTIFRREFFKIIETLPSGYRQKIRYWDRAATSGAGDFSVGAKLSIDNRGFVFVEDIVRGQWSPGSLEQVIHAASGRDGTETLIYLEQEPGSSGVADVQYLIRSLSGYSVYSDKKTGSKLDMARPFAAQAEAGNVFLLKAPWNESFIQECEAFAGDGKGTDDQVDASSGAFSKLRVGRGEVVFL